MLSIYETYCHLQDLTIGKRMFLLYGSASPLKHDSQTGHLLDGAVVAEIVYSLKLIASVFTGMVYAGNKSIIDHRNSI